MSKRSMFVLMLALFAMMAFPGCASSHECASCARIDKTGNGWCESCTTGEVHGQEVHCKGCYMVMTGKANSCPVCNK